MYQMATIAIASKDFLFTLRQSNLSTQVIAKTIQNKKVCIQKAKFGNCLPILALKNQFWKEKICFDYCMNTANQIIHLFFSTP